jgi:endogenous inhibitor of DNA gyrase (YacG/DUF329 family)
MSAEKKITVSCPRCKKTVVWNEQPQRPFCSERCKLIDLGEWAAEEKRIAGDPVYPEFDYDSFLH